MIIAFLRRFVPLAFLATAMCGLVYLAVQQDMRQGANDPQVQMAEDAAAGAAIPTSTVDINESLAPYLVLYDASGDPVAGNGLLDGALPRLPAGVFAYASQHGEDHVTWQPRPGIRQAIVVVQTASGYAMAGRSLREVEAREDKLGFQALAVWLCTMIGLVILELLYNRK
ncbi:MAG TPA: hypothetical protein VMT81_03305 [Candidatus Paceibacterota bacterium]|nr:hypothetical protein [Candidatus Paceibacterota bacterium]